MLTVGAIAAKTLLLSFSGIDAVPAVQAQRRQRPRTRRARPHRGSHAWTADRRAPALQIVRSRHPPPKPRAAVPVRGRVDSPVRGDQATNRPPTIRRVSHEIDIALLSLLLPQYECRVSV